MLMTDNLRKAFGDNEAVKGVSFSVLRGEIFSLLGPNGAGKTTTISMLSCLLEPTSGTAVIGGHSITNDNLRVRELIGIVPQEIALYDELTARQNLVFWGQMYNLSGKALKARIDEVLEQVNLTDRANDRVGTFSGGMKRRINIAAGLLHKPQLLFMDEPTVGIDPQSRRRILDMVKELRDQGMTVLYTTHYMEEAEELSDRVGIIDHGELIAVGTQAELTKTIGQQETLRLHLGEGFTGEEQVHLFEDLPGVLAVTALNGEVALSVTEAEEALPGAISRANGAGVPVRTIDIEEPNLEAVFLHLTGRALRD
ncbi:MAG: ATP-binding cassette domain-containing protein [Ardenticatenaceae bacterium]|nr:ATP-binding cassette domain-containing protein [Ardenticatenaceae bacterium]MCB8990784.1 ATP-binding cassette domain-containing protein [Ardenticatenaceae bacterium]MCB9003271.1 ATP-binding cassette domain-containing protein [Ardenticatenaceae bacterium]